MRPRMSTIVDTPSREVVSTGFWINVCGRHTGGEDYQLPARTSADHVLIFTVGGAGWFRVGNSVRAPLAPGDLLVLPAGVEHGYGAGEGWLWDLQWAHIAGPDAARLLGLWPRTGHGLKLIRRSPQETSSLMTKALTEMHERREAYGLAAAAHIQHLMRLAIVSARRESAAPDPATGHAQQIQDYLDANVGNPLTLRQIADHFSLNASYLCRVFKSATGYSPMEYRAKQRMNRAKDLLRATELPISAVARRLGFDDPAYFSRAFRTSAGVSPSSFRQSLASPDSSE